ncbi:CS domain family protein [Babesia bovis T2Bo]|uniref:CS domain-containing protein n=1 Tax=Babesia bovis TaxID=5865 RepID=A7AN96_BABBO|nr:CS domain family protein [Babesia bovis T2Bo]EDO08030.1 CS domain family protein [Babesia bovis T2Bo]|eukprot:XP_001611598.1 hypothetical protein [Babesia bovis T2Bo]
MALSPNVLWAQTDDALLLTVELPEEKDTVINLDNNALKIAGKKEGKDYECTINFYKPIKASEALKANDRFLRFKLPKDENEKWPSLNNDGKKHWIKIDWNRWIDSDAEDNETNVIQDDFDMSKFGPFGNMGGYPGMGDDDDDFMDDEEHECCEQSECACDDCECDTICKCGADCECENCSCVKECKCDGEVPVEKVEDTKKPCDCCDNCTCGDNCQCTPENKCSEKCSCPGK